MILIIGLGNPGASYRGHRHNVGFQVLDTLAQREGLHFTEKAIFESEVAELGQLLLAKPTTWMNNSGAAARALAKQWHAPLACQSARCKRARCTQSHHLGAC